MIAETLLNISFVSILGVKIANISRCDAIKLMEQLIQQEPGSTRTIFIVNAHTLNLAVENPEYRDVLNCANKVFPDGTGVRCAARLRGTILKNNLVGTDLIPEFLSATSNRDYRYFLLGADAATIARAAQVATERFPGWQLVGYHHGYFTTEETDSIIEQINSAQPHLLLVGMGNPKQECWLHAHQHRLQVPLGIGVGGLFDHWGSNLKRAPLWVRKLGCEWIQLLLQQPHKWGRYIIGNPKYIIRIIFSLN